MFTSICNAILQTDSNELVAIKKGKETTLVYREEYLIVVTSASKKIGSEPFIKLSKSCDNVMTAHNEMHRIVGKLVCKPDISKYFDCPKFDEHLSNGLKNIELTDKLRNILIAMAQYAIAAYFTEKTSQV